MKHIKTPEYWFGYLVGSIAALILGRLRLSAIVSPEQAVTVNETAEKDPETPEKVPVKPKAEVWEMFVDPKVIGSVDTFGEFNKPRGFVPLETYLTAENVFAWMARKSLEVYDKTPGAKDADVTTHIGVWMANRCLTVSSKFQIRICEEHNLPNVIHPASERCRLQNLDRALRCFLN